MTKAEIVQALYARVGGFSKKESADLVDLVFETMKETLGRGEKIKISGFGNFVLRDKRQRPGRNPQTGDPIQISARRVMTFKASQVLKQVLNPRQSSAAPPRASGTSPVANPVNGHGAGGHGVAGHGVAGHGVAGHGVAGQSAASQGAASHGGNGGLSKEAPPLAAAAGAAHETSYGRA